jgi:hypothetical protein
MSDQVFDTNPTTDLEPLAEVVQGVLDGDVEVPREGLDVGNLIEPKQTEKDYTALSADEVDDLSPDELAKANATMKEVLAEAPSVKQGTAVREAQAADAAIGRQVREQMAAVAAAEQRDTVLEELSAAYWADDSPLRAYNEESGDEYPTAVGVQLLEKLIEAGMDADDLAEVIGPEEWAQFEVGRQEAQQQEQILTNVLQPAATAEAEWTRLQALGENHKVADAAAMILAEVAEGFIGASDEHVREGVLKAFQIAAEIHNTSSEEAQQEREVLAAAQSGYDSIPQFRDYLMALSYSEKPDEKMEHDRIADFIYGEKELNLKKLFPNLEEDASIEDAITSGDRNALRTASNKAANDAAALVANSLDWDIEVVEDVDSPREIPLSSGKPLTMAEMEQERAKRDKAAQASVRKAALKRAGLR